MPTTHTRTPAAVLALLAGAAGLALTPAANAGSTFTCTISGFQWLGGSSDDFFTDGNWDTCIGIPAPQTDMPIYFGPQALHINGFFDHWQIPFGPCVVAADYTTPSVLMANGVDTYFTVRDSTYTSTGTIGVPGPVDFNDPGTVSTLTLDNAVWNGSLTIGQNGGNGVLELLGTSFLTGGISFGSGDGTIFYNGTNTFSFSLNNSSSGSVAWINASGAVLNLGNMSFSRSWPNQPADFINEAGATIRKTGIQNSSIGWDTENNGALIVDEGTLDFYGNFRQLGGSITCNSALIRFEAGFEGSGGLIDINGGIVLVDGPLSGAAVVIAAPGGRFDIHGDVPVNAAFNITGDTNISGVAGGGVLDLDGTFHVVSAGNIGVNIVNAGLAVFASTAFANNNSVEPASWRNIAGAELEFQGGHISRSWFNQPADFINETGATVRKTGTQSSSIGWDTENNGSLINDEGVLDFFGNFRYLGGSITCNTGQLRFEAGFEGSGGLIDILGGTVQVNGPLSGSAVVIASPGGRFDIHGDVPANAAFDITGHTQIFGVSGGGQLDLDGAYVVTGAGNIGVDIVNAGLGVFASTAFANNNSVEPASWRNIAGAELEFQGGHISRSWINQPADLINEAGATIRKTGTQSSTIGWDTEHHGALVNDEGTFDFFGNFRFLDGSITCNAGNLDFEAGFEGSGGLIDILGGTVQVDGPLSGSAVVVAAPGGRFDIHGDVPANAAFDITGHTQIFGVSGGGQLDLDGAYVVTGAGNIGVDIVNAGLGVFASTAFANNNSVEPASWRNIAGAELEFQGGHISRSWPAQPADFINEAGATVRKTGAQISTIGWDFTNEGTLDIAEGTLSISAPDPQLKSLTSLITGTGTLDFTTAPALFNLGTLNPAATDLAANPAGLTIDVPFIQNDDTAVFRTQVGSLAGKLTCTGVYDVGGAIDIQRFGEFEPDGSEQFIVIEAVFVSGVFGDYFTNAVPIVGNTALNIRTGDLEYDVVYTPTAIIIENVSVIVPPCNPADLAEPGGLLDLADVLAFTVAFSAGDPIADIAEPFGLFDLADVIAFTDAFLAGCP